jgi:RNA recognition motif-containing protein
VVSKYEATLDSTNKQNQQPNPSNVLGVFGLSIRTQERDLEDEFSRFGRVEKVTIVYDQRVSHRRLSIFHSQLTPALSLIALAASALSR